MGALVALWLLLKYHSKTQNSFANIKEEKQKKTPRIVGLWQKKNSGEKRVTEEAKLRFIIG